MKFSYLKFPAQPTEAFPDRKWASRPVLPVTLKNEDKKITIQALIDSGYYHNIKVEIGGWEYECYCGFSYDINHLPYGLLGQNDFFKKFKIVFDYSKDRF